MTGSFYISISNGLLSDGHRKRMGAAVWEFMWCIDKVTRIEEDGTGWVLGGKPIKLSDIALQLEVDEDTVSTNLAKLEAEHYITKTRTPYGNILKVLKAKKRFGKSSESKGNRESAGSLRENSVSTITVSVDSTPETTIASKLAKEKSPHKIFVEFFYEVCQKARGIKPIITGKDASQLKRILDSGINEQVLEKIALVFLADPSLKRFSPTIATMCSGGILTGLLNRSRNDPAFPKDLDYYADRFFPRSTEVKKVVQITEMQEALKKLGAKLTIQNNQNRYGNRRETLFDRRD